MKQIRFVNNVDCALEVREPQEGQTESRVVVGKPIIFGVRSVNLTPWSETRKVYEILEPGCLSPELMLRSDVVLNINHSNKVTDVLGRCNNGKGTLSLRFDGNYIQCECDLPKTNAANDTLELIRRGDISGMSFAFEDDREDSENGVSYERTNEIEDGKEIWLRHVKKITGLYDVSIVTHPAYEQTSVDTREVDEEIEKAIERQIREQEEVKKPVEEEPAKTEEKNEKEIQEREQEEMKQKEIARKNEQLRHIRRELTERELQINIY